MPSSREAGERINNVKFAQIDTCRRGFAAIIFRVVPVPRRRFAARAKSGATPASIMAILHCSRCQTLFPLSRPRRVGNLWYALCADCKQDTEVEPVAASGARAPSFRVKAERSASARPA
jgi:hypothetical protein